MRFPSVPPYSPCALLRKEGFCEVKFAYKGYPNYAYEFFFGVATGEAGQFDGPGIYMTVSPPGWLHVAVTYDSTTGQKRIYINGVSKSASFNQKITYGTVPTTDAVIGGTSLNPTPFTLGFYLDEVRVSSGVRYTGNFTPPAAPFSPDGATAALWHFDDGEGVTTFADSSINGNTLSGYNGAVGVGNVNHAPTDIGLSNATVPENQPSGTAVGTLSTTDPDAGNTFTYTLVSGAGSTDNASFAISGSTLRTAASFNYEVKSSYSARVRTADQGGLWHEEPFTITVVDVDEPPPTFQSLEMGSGGTVVLRWSSIANHHYTLHEATDLRSGFSVLEASIPCTPPMNTHTDNVTGVNTKFWKVTTEE